MVHNAVRAALGDSVADDLLEAIASLLGSTANDPMICKNDRLSEVAQGMQASMTAFQEADGYAARLPRTPSYL